MRQLGTQDSLSAAENLNKALKKNFKGSGVIVKVENLDGSQLIGRFIVDGDDAKTLFTTLNKLNRTYLSILKTSHQYFLKCIEKLEKT